MEAYHTERVLRELHRRRRGQPATPIPEPSYQE
jgi:hypothetical protein